MKLKNSNLFWGLVLVLAGAVFLAQNLGWIPDFGPQTWAFALAGLSLLFFATYFVSGVAQWGWLLPAFICAGTAVTIFLAESGVDASWVAAPVLLGVSLPFFIVYLLDRKNWWALIPGWTMLVISAVVSLEEFIDGEWVATLILWGIALPFLVVFLTDRSRWWALIPFGVMGIVGAIPALTTVADDDLIGGLLMFLFALPFFVVFLARQGNWWALIPGGVLATIGVTVFAATRSDLSGGREAALVNGILFLGFGVTFGVLWLLRNRQPTAWAIYPSLVLAGIGLLSFFLGVNVNLGGPLLLIAGGAALLYFGLRPRQSPPPGDTPS